MDYFQGVGDVQRVVDTARELNEALGEIPILFTFRTKREGGEKEIGMEDYTALNRAVAQSSYVDAVDVEIFSGDEVVRKNIAAILRPARRWWGPAMNSTGHRSTPSSSTGCGRCRIWGPTS